MPTSTGGEEEEGWRGGGCWDVEMSREQEPEGRVYIGVHTKFREQSIGCLALSIGCLALSAQSCLEPTPLPVYVCANEKYHM